MVSASTKLSWLLQANMCTQRWFQSVGEFPDMHLFTVFTLQHLFFQPTTEEMVQDMLRWTILSAGVQNILAFWEMWFNAEGLKLSVVIGSLLQKLAWPKSNYSEKVPMMQSYLLRAISLLVSCNPLSFTDKPTCAHSFCFLPPRAQRASLFLHLP